jgi:hypothetical protein
MEDSVTEITNSAERARVIPKKGKMKMPDKKKCNGRGDRT